MRIQILLNPDFANSSEIEAELRGEIQALAIQGARVTTENAPPPAGTLPLDQVAQFIIEHAGDIKELLPVITAALQVTVEVLRRRGVKSNTPPAKKTKVRKKGRETVSSSNRRTPVVIMLVDGKKLELPVSVARQHKFLSELAKSTRENDRAIPKRRRGKRQ
jgi:hypothetical protein